MSFNGKRKWSPQRSPSLPAQGRRESAPPPVTQPPAAAPAPKKPIKVEGNPDLWKTLQRVTDPNSGWTKTTRAMQLPAGVLINTCSRKAGSSVVTEALAFVPCAVLSNTDGQWNLHS